MAMPPKERTIVAPEGGWKERQYYLVETASTPDNIIHQSIFFSGFLHKGEPAGYNVIFNHTYEDRPSVSETHYLKPIRELDIELD